MKLSKVEEGEVLRNWCLIAIKNEGSRVKEELSTNYRKVEEEIFDIHKEFVVPGLIGETEKYETLKEYLEKEYTANRQNAI